MNEKNKVSQTSPVIIIGAGLTGLSTAFFLRSHHIDVIILEKENRVGGQIHTHAEQGFVFESGPNTGVLSYPEIVEMFDALGDACRLEVAREGAKKRLIWKGRKFHALPAGLLPAVTTPLFRFTDKLRILGEPWRKKGTNPDETVAQLAARRLGKSFVDYAVDPFLSGVYAGDPNRLVTRYALPKLYNLEQNYGSFIRGTIAKAKEPKPERDKKATKQVFSAAGGLNSLVDALQNYIGTERILTGVSDTQVIPDAAGGWQVTFKHQGKQQTVTTRQVVTTTGSYSLPELLPFVDKDAMKQINNLYYAPIVQAAVCLPDEVLPDFQVFGGLIPSREHKDILGILNPSACFARRTAGRGNTLAIFMGGVRHPEYITMTDEQLREIVLRNLRTMLGINTQPTVIRFFRHTRTIPQYEVTSGERFAAIAAVEEQYKGLYIKGNLCGGIGMGDRIHQAYQTAESIRKCINN